MHILIIGGTGQVGGATIAALRARGHDPVAASRHPGPDGVRIDLRDPASVEAGARGFDTAFLLTPLGPDEGEVGVAAVAALRRAGVAKIVYLAIMNLEAMRAIPHFETKIPIKAAVLAQGGSVVLEPNFFMANDMMVLPAILNAGVYPLPIGSAGVWSVAPGDLGAAAANALTRDDWDGQAVSVCGPEALTGPGLAADWSEATGRTVVYPGDAIAPIIDQLGRMIPGFDDWARRDFTTMLEVTQTMGCPSTHEQQVASRAIVGRAPTRHIDYARAVLANSRETHT